MPSFSGTFASGKDILSGTYAYGASVVSGTYAWGASAIGRVAKKVGIVSEEKEASRPLKKQKTGKKSPTRNQISPALESKFPWASRRENNRSAPTTSKDTDECYT